MGIPKSHKSRQKTTVRRGSIPPTTDALEKALRDLGHKEIPLKEKCAVMIDVCNRLEKLYKKSGDAVNATRIQNLRDKAKALV